MGMIAKRFLGESIVTMGRGIYALRPSFAALYAIEQRTGATIPQTIEHIDGVGCKPEIVRCVIEAGVDAFYGELPTLSRLSRKEWLMLRQEAITFLIQGLGYLVDIPASSAPIVLPTQANTLDAKQMNDGVATSVTSDTSVPSSPQRFEPINWPQLYKVATGMLGRSEAEFWQMTMCGLMQQCEAHAASLGIEITDIGQPATRQDLREMMQLYPDASLAA